MKSRIFSLPADELLDLYWTKGLSTQEIADQVGFSRKTVSYWMQKYGIRRRSGSEASPGKRVNLDLSPTLAYVLGICFGDGSVYVTRSGHDSNTYKVSLDARSKQFASEFKRALERLGFNAWLFRRNGGMWRTCACSKPFHNWFQSLSPNDLRRILAKKEMAREFVKGFYESEGSYFFVRKGERALAMSNKKLWLIELVRESLEKLGFELHMYFNQGKELWTLRTARGEQIDSFLNTINPCIKRKPSNARRYRLGERLARSLRA